MLNRFFNTSDSRETESVKDRAGELFASGLNCAQAVLQACTGIDDPGMMEMAKPFGGGVGGTRCLCGAVSGGVMALGYMGKGKKAGDLMKAFRERYKVTCCVTLSRPYVWKSKDHLDNCRRITEETAGIVEDFLKE